MGERALGQDGGCWVLCGIPHRDGSQSGVRFQTRDGVPDRDGLVPDKDDGFQTGDGIPDSGGVLKLR